MASIILKACAFEPDDRYIDAGEMLCDLDLAARGSAPEQRYSWEKEEKPDFIPESQRTEAAALPVETQKNKNESVPEKSSTQSEDEITKGFRSAIPWIAAIVAVAAIVCVFIGIFIRKTLVDTVREQTQQMLTSIQSKSEVQPEDNGQDSCTVTVIATGLHSEPIISKHIVPDTSIKRTQFSSERPAGTITRRPVSVTPARKPVQNPSSIVTREQGKITVPTFVKKTNREE